MGIRRALLAVVAGLLAIGLLAPAAGGQGLGDADAARAVAGLAGPEPLDALPEGLAGGYRPAEVVLVDGAVRAVKPGGGCSVAWGGRPFGFDDACRAHDLGYDLLRYAAAQGAPLAPAARRTIDATFARDLHAHCDATGAGAACHAQAALYTGVTGFNSWRQRHGPPVHEPVAAWAAGLTVSALLALSSPPRPVRSRRRTRWPALGHAARAS